MPVFAAALTNKTRLYKIKYNSCIQSRGNMIQQIQKKAYAKINLGLDVLRRRPDGYHEVKMIMQTVDLFDRLTICKSEQPGITFTMEAEGQAVTSLVPVDDTNLVCKAARKLIEKYPIKEGVHFVLQKNIPVAAGMAGGSTDAAAALVGMNELFDMQLSVEELQKIAVTIGADVPYCVVGGTALSEGIGEKLTRLTAPPQCGLVIVKPAVSVSTRYVYENLHVETLEHHPDIDGMVEALQTGNLAGITERMENVLERVTVKEYPLIARVKENLETLGAKKALMSGSGPTVFGVFEDAAEAKAAAEAMEQSILKKNGQITQIIATGFYEPDNYGKEQE